MLLPRSLDAPPSSDPSSTGEPSSSNVVLLDGLPPASHTSSPKEKLFVVLRFYRTVRSGFGDRGDELRLLRRPHGVAVVGPVPPREDTAESSQDHHLFSSRIYLCEESKERDFHHLHDAIMRGSAPAKSVWSNAKVEVGLQAMPDGFHHHGGGEKGAAVAGRMEFVGTAEPGIVRYGFHSFFTKRLVCHNVSHCFLETTCT